MLEPKRRIQAGLRTSVGLGMRYHMDAQVRLSESSWCHADGGERSAPLDCADIDAFANTPAFLEQFGQISVSLPHLQRGELRQPRGVESSVRGQKWNRKNAKIGTFNVFTHVASSST